MSQKTKQKCATPTRRPEFRLRPVVRLDGDLIGYCMDRERPDDCLRPAIATVTQIPVREAPDPRLDERLRREACR